MTAIGAVARGLARSWRHELLRAFGGSRLAYRGVVAGLVAVLVVWTVLIASTRDLVETAPFEQADLVSLLVTLSLTVVVAMGAIGTATLALLVPDSGAFATLLATMPVGRVVRRVALELPVLVSGTVIALAVPAPFVWITAQALPGGGSAVGLVVSCALLAVTAVLVASAGARLLTALIAAVGVPTTVGRSIATVVVAGLVGQQALTTRTDLTGGSALRQVLSWLAGLIETRPWAAVGAAGAALVVTAASWAVAAGVGQTRVSAQSVRLVGPRARTGRLVPRRLTVLELCQIARHPTNVSTVTLIGLVLVALLAVEGLREAVLWPLGGAALVLAAPVVAVASYGATWTSHWCYRAWTARPTTWVAPKWTGSAVYCGAVAVVVAGALFVTPEWDLEGVLGLLPHVLLGFAVAFFVGLLVPVGEDQPLSALAALLLTVGGATGLAVGLTALVGSNVPAGVAAAAAVTALLVPAYSRLARWRERDLVP